MNIKFRNLFFLFLFFFMLVSATFCADDNQTIDSQKAQKYNDYTYNIYMILLGIFSLLAIVTAMMVMTHYGFKHLAYAIGGFIFVFGLYFLVF